MATYELKQVTMNFAGAMSTASLTYGKFEDGKVWDYMVVLTGEDKLDDLVANFSKDYCDYLLNKDLGSTDPSPKMVALWKAENAYITFMQSLGLPDKASTEEIEALCMALFNSGVQGNINQALMISAKALALINNVTQNGGTWADITWHEGV